MSETALEQEALKLRHCANHAQKTTGMGKWRSREEESIFERKEADKTSSKRTEKEQIFCLESAARLLRSSACKRRLALAKMVRGKSVRSG